MNSNTFIKIKRPTKSTPQPQDLPQVDRFAEVQKLRQMSRSLALAGA